MDHIAILKKQWKLLERIRSGKKTIESRWYMQRRVPWNRIAAGEHIYFKNSGEPVTLRATVTHVEQYENLTPKKVADLMRTYQRMLGITDERLPGLIRRNASKKYCILTFLGDVKEIERFEIDKTGFGIMAAWISVDKISNVKI